MERTDIVILLDIYGELLANAQRDALDMRYNDDLSLAEIAVEMGGVTRQSVLYSIRKGEQKLAELESTGRLMAVVTQNIDGLHQKAGSKNVYELHGSVLRNYCMKCGRFYSAEDLMKTEGVPYCDCGGVIKPDVVLYEEGLDTDTIQKSIRAISEADVLIVGGTSLAVYPAAGLIDYFQGDKVVLINKGATSRDAHADLVIKEPIGEILGAIRVE